MRTYLHCIYCKGKTRIQGEKCHTLRSRCACVWIYMVANLILLCSLKHISLDWNLKILCKKTWAILFIFILLFSGGHLSTHCFRYLEHLSIFFYFLFFMNNFCIDHASFSAIETFQEWHLQELGVFILSIIFLCLFPI